VKADRVITPEKQEMLALALEEAALQVRQSIPDSVEMDVEDDAEQIKVGCGQTLDGMRSPRSRTFRIKW